MITKQKVDRIGGVGSMLVGVVCLWFASEDWATQQSIWKVWVGMCVLLVLNGIAMMRHAQRNGATGNEGKTIPPVPDPTMARVSPRH